MSIVIKLVTILDLINGEDVKSMIVDFIIELAQQIPSILVRFPSHLTKSSTFLIRFISRCPYNFLDDMVIIIIIF